MYYPIGYPKRLDVSLPDNELGEIRAVVCNRDRNFFAIISENSISIWLSRPCVRLTLFKRDAESVQNYGANCCVEWRHDTSMLAVATDRNYLIFYSLSLDSKVREAYEQDDSPMPGLRRHSAELYNKESIPPLRISQVSQLELCGKITGIVGLRDELMIATFTGHIQRVRWNGTINNDYSIDLRRIPFCDDQLVMRAVPLDTPGVFVSHIEYSPLVGGFAIVLNDGRAAFLTATTLQFDPNAVQGIWAKELEDATCAAINHKYRLLAFGKANSQGLVMTVDEVTGGLEVCHKLALQSKDYPGNPGPVGQLRWTPDGTALGMCWKHGGFSLWSVFGSLLTASLQWDYASCPLSRPLQIKHMEWGAEGYEMWCVRESCTNIPKSSNGIGMPPFNGHVETTAEPMDPLLAQSALLQISFIKSALAVNPCMSRLERVLLHGSDRLYLSTRESVEGEGKDVDGLYQDDDEGTFDPMKRNHKEPQLNVAASRQWLVIPIPHNYTASNWPIRYTCLDDEGEYVGVAGKNGVAHYSINGRRWHLFGNETQESDMVVTGGLIWWRSQYLILGAYSIPSNEDQIRIYPRTLKLDDQFATIVQQEAQVLLLNIYGNHMVVLTADRRITVYTLRETQPIIGPNSVTVTRIQEVDISGLAVHPACVISVSLTSLRTESWRTHSIRPVQLPVQSIIFNISGKVLMIQRDTPQSAPDNGDTKLFQQAEMTPIVLASCCESLWFANRTVSHKPHLSHALWLHCGAHGTRAWLPLFPAPGSDKGHAFMARRIMLPFTPSIYPLAVLFEEAIIIGAETATSVVSCDNTTQYQPLGMIERTSQVYLHHLLRQLLRRNLGYHAWEVANTCRHLPYFPHALELLLHQVLEEEATSKDPIPDSLLPRVLDFIREFPVHLLTVVQCARKTELALWRYLFSVAGSPRHLFTQALEQGQLDTAASYLLILQNLESSFISRSHATRLLEATLNAYKWDLSKDLIRFLRSIDRTDLESPKASNPVSSGTRIGYSHTSPVSPQCADVDLSMIMPSTQALRVRSLSTTSGPKGSEAVSMSPPSGHHSALRTVSDSTKSRSQSISPMELRKVSSSSAGKDVTPGEEYFIDLILNAQAKKLLIECRLRDLGTMAAHLDFPLVSWLRKERGHAAAVTDFVGTLRAIHEDFSWPFPSVAHSTDRKYSGSSNGSTDIKQIDEKMQLISLNIPKKSSLNGGEVGDSGYLSQSTYTADTRGSPMTPQHTFPSIRNEAQLPISALLTPLTPVTDLQSVLSDGSIYGDESLMCDNDWNPEDPTRNILARPPDPPHQAHPQPPPHAEVQLRYLLQIFLEAGCLELSVIIAVVLRDALAILRVVNLAKSPDTPTAILNRLVHGLNSLAAFTNTQCLGYQSIMSVVMGQSKVIQRFAAAREYAARTPVPSTPDILDRSKPSPTGSSVKMGSETSLSRKTSAPKIRDDCIQSEDNVSVGSRNHPRRDSIVFNEPRDETSDAKKDSHCIIS